MVLALPFPAISPEIFSISLGPISFSLRWYAVAYIAGLLIALWLVRSALRRATLWPAQTPPMSLQQAEALLTWVVLGVIIGGRLGFVLFYQPGYYLSHPADIVKVWQGGMAFHGGLLGVVVAAALFCRRHDLPRLSVADVMALATPPGLLLGRLANFINAELWGRPTSMPWGVVFPGHDAQTCPVDWVGPCARHPSQLYEGLLEGIALGVLLQFLAFRYGALRFPGRICGLFFFGYGAIRFFVEFFRQADPQFTTPENPWGHVLAIGDYGLTMGQILSLPMILIGLAVLLISERSRRTA